MNIYLANHNYRGLTNLPRVLCEIKTDSTGAKYIYQDDIFAEQTRVGNGSLLEILLEEYARENNVTYITGRMVESNKISLSGLRDFYQSCGFEVTGTSITKQL